MLSLTLVVVAVLSIVGVGGFVLSRSAPLWWRTIDAGDAGTVRLADDLEQAVGRQLTLVRQPASDLEPEGPWRSAVWKTAIACDDANAWLNINLPNWLASDPDLPNWPRDIDTLQVRFADGVIQVGIEVRQGDRSVYLTASLHPKIDAAGALWLRATSVQVGRLPIPADLMLGHADGNLERFVPPELHDKVHTLIQLFAGDEPLPNPVIRLGDGRQVRLLDIEPRARKLVVTCRTERTGTTWADRDE